MERKPERIEEEIDRLEEVDVGLEKREREIGETRGRLHRAIDALRAKIGLPPRRAA